MGFLTEEVSRAKETAVRSTYNFQPYDAFAFLFPARVVFEVVFFQV